jgi:HEAT repeat protein
MRRCIIAVLALGMLTATWAGAKNWAKELDSRDDEKRVRAARELLTKALAQGLSENDIEALAAAVDDASEDVQGRAVEALAANTDIGTSQQYAPYFAARGDNLVAFLLWYSVYETYARVIRLSGGEGGGDMRDEMAHARKEAERAFANMLDPERKRWAQPYYEALME